MKLKLILLLIAVVFTMTTLQAYNFMVDGIGYTITSAKVPYAVAVDHSSYTGTVTIPASVSNNSTSYSVTSIAMQAFVNCSGLTSVTIPSSVTTIGDRAFWGCTGLTAITIPNSVTSIGIFAFSDCTGLTAVSISTSVTSIGKSTFYNCKGLTSVTIPSSVTTIGNEAFNGCSGLTSVTIPNSVTSIGESAFYGCTGLTSVTIPSSVTSIGVQSFISCRKLTAVTIPNSVTSIGNSAFAGCGLTSVAIPSSVSTIGNSAFSYCTDLTSVTIATNTISATSIGDNAFEYCSKLSSVTIPSSVTSIGGSAFYKCIGLSTITIPASVIFIGEMAFFQCSGLTSIYADSSTPINLSSIYFAFGNINKTTCTLYVPTGSKNLYAAAPVWKDFTNIVEHTVSSTVPVAQVLNGEFDNGTQDWNLSTNATGAAATMKIDNNSVISGPNSCAVTITQATGTDWHIQLWQGFSVYPNHKYTITFKAKASAARSIALSLQKGVSPYTTYLYQTHNLTTQVQTFTDEVTINTMDQAKLLFCLGASTGSVWIDEITIVDTPLTTFIDLPIASDGYISFLQNFPNPFTSTTKIKYIITEPGLVSLKVYNGLGQEVTTLVNEKKPVGDYTIDWNAMGLIKGIYFGKLQNGNNTEVRKMILMK
jgi:hypothetical protein